MCSLVPKPSPATVGHVGLMQQAMGDVGAGFDPALAEERRHVRIRVKCALRHACT